MGQVNFQTLKKLRDPAGRVQCAVFEKFMSADLFQTAIEKNDKVIWVLG